MVPCQLGVEKGEELLEVLMVLLVFFSSIQIVFTLV